MKVFTDCLIVGSAGFFGCVARYLLTLGFRNLSLTFPLGTVAVNILGCFVIGLLSQLISTEHNISPQMRLAIAVGFCGGFTTMSSFVYEMAEFMRLGEHFYAFLYFAGTLTGSFLAFYLGYFILKAKIGG